MDASQPEPTRLTSAARFVFTADWLPWIGFFLLVVGARLWLVDQFGSAMPILDQWDDEAARIFKPYLEGTLGLGQLFAPHNEHRHVLARLLSLALLICNGQWDSRVQMAANALFAACLALHIAFLGVRLLGTSRRPIVLAAVACWSCLPFAWENTTWGFQSSSYFLVLLSVVAIAGLIARPNLGGQWWLAAVAAVAGCFTMASGFLAAVSVLVVLGMRCLRRRKMPRALLPSALLLVGVIVLGVVLREHVAGHDILRAASVGQWTDGFLRCLAWPFTRYPAASVLVYAPSFALAGWYLWRRKIDGERASDVKSEIVLGLSLWVALRAAAIAYGRGSDLAKFMPPRYTDILALGGLANLFAVFVLASESTLQARARLPARLLGSAWAAGIAVGVASLALNAVGDLRGRPAYLRQAEEHVRAYVATGDASHLADESVQAAYPWPDRLAGFLDDPTIRGILPAALRTPLTLQPEGPSAPFEPQTRSPGERMWGSGPDNNEAVGVMRTAAIEPSLPYLWIELHGSLSRGISLRLEDVESGAEHRVVFSPNTGGWRDGYAVAPRQMRVIARDENTQRSLRFTEPRELGRLSYFAERLLSISREIVLAGLALVTALFVFGHTIRGGAERTPLKRHFRALAGSDS